MDEPRSELRIGDRVMMTAAARRQFPSGVTHGTIEGIGRRTPTLYIRRDGSKAKKPAAWAAIHWERIPEESPCRT